MITIKLDWNKNNNPEQYDDQPSCDFLVPQSCSGIVSTIKPGTSGGYFGCNYEETNEHFRVICSRHHTVGPGTKCKMFCINDPLEIEHEVGLQK